MERQFIGLDFDGVLCDSINECLLVALNTYFEMLGQNKTCFDLADVAPELLQYFRQNRHFVRPAGEYFLLFHSFFQKSVASFSPSSFAELARIHIKEINEFEKMFFIKRKDLRERSMNCWLSLHTFYPRVADVLTHVNEEKDVAIITTKDEASVGLLLETIAVRNIQIYGNEQIKRFGSKGKVISFLLDEHHLSSADFHYLDDNLEHLRDVQPLAVHCYYAAWGYSQAEAGTMDEQFVYCEDIHRFFRHINETYQI